MSLESVQTRDVYSCSSCSTEYKYCLLMQYFIPICWPVKPCSVVGGYQRLGGKTAPILERLWREHVNRSQQYRHCRKVASSIPDYVFGIFHSLNTSDRKVALDSNQPLKYVSTKLKGGRYVGLTNLQHSCAECLEKVWASNLLEQ
jgi:hypothetical protein